MQIDGFHDINCQFVIIWPGCIEFDWWIDPTSNTQLFKDSKVTASDKRIRVFAGSSPGSRPEYTEAAEQLGEELCARGYDLVYGGGRVGLMGAVADSVLANGGQVIGIIPEALAEKEVAHQGLT